LDISLLSHFLPAGLLEHFTITSVLELGEVSTKTVYFDIHLEEKNILLKENASEYESKGFTEIILQDFPIRGKAVYLKIRRRRWRHKERPNEIVRNDFSFVAVGSGFTKELSDFLKGTGRYEGRYDHEHQ
jgi:hypothetical protein